MEIHLNVRISFTMLPFVNQQPMLYPTDLGKISFVCSLLIGKALEWATAVWREDGSTFPSFEVFLQRFKEVFDHPAGGKSAGEQLLMLNQGRKTAAEYAVSFRTLAAQTDWTEDALKLMFRKGLSLELQSELACRDEGRTLNEFIELSIQIDNLIRSRRPVRALANDTPDFASHSEPMQLGYTHLTPEERDDSYNIISGCTVERPANSNIMPRSSSQPEFKIGEFLFSFQSIYLQFQNSNNSYQQR